MYGIVVFIHVIVCIGLILVVLFQAGKGAGLGNLFGGGGGGDQLFSAPSGSAFIRKATTTIAIIFVLTSIFLTIMSSHSTRRSLMERVPSVPEAPSNPARP
ncbi:MAG: preprotein translocase subunit SecG [Elusimicrobiota bacterium]|jgi:preprotein translocase subunit SecG